MKYILLEIELDENEKFLDASYVLNCDGIKSAFIELESHTKKYVTRHFGQDAGNNSKIRDIHSFDQVVRPNLDGILLYRLDVDPNIVYAFKRKTYETTSWMMMQSYSTVFYKCAVFKIQLLETKKSDNENESNIEMIKGPHNLNIPKLMTIKPMCDLIIELKQSEKFLKNAQYVEDNSVVTCTS